MNIYNVWTNRESNKIVKIRKALRDIFDKAEKVKIVLAHLQDERRTTSEDSDVGTVQGDRHRERQSRRWSDEIMEWRGCQIEAAQLILDKMIEWYSLTDSLSDRSRLQKYCTWKRLVRRDNSWLTCSLLAYMLQYSTVNIL